MIRVTAQGTAANKTGRNDIVARVRRAVAGNDLPAAERLARVYREELGSAPETLEAFSWVARGALNAHRFAKAANIARQVHGTAARRLRETGLDSEPHLATALGASIEVLAQVLVKRGRRAEAASFLKHELAKFGATSASTRIRKNLNLLTIEGQPAPELEIRSWIGVRPPSLVDLRGRAVLLFFWAHYCEDSRAQGRVLVRIRKQFDRAGLALIGPTRRYGYLDEQQRCPTGKQRENQHMKWVLNRYYSDLSDMLVPIGESNFVVYGVSTTPTLVLVDREGLVDLYHPGKAPYGALAARLQKLLLPT